MTPTRWAALVFSIGACEELQELRLDLDTTLACGGDMVAAVAKMLHRLAKTPKLEALSLGYSWFSDASDETLQDLRDAWKNLEQNCQPKMKLQEKLIKPDMFPMEVFLV